MSECERKCGQERMYRRSACPAQTVRHSWLSGALALGFCLSLSSTAPAGENDRDSLTLSDLSATRDRPLFSPSRRPPPVAVAPTKVKRTRSEPPAARPPAVNLAGVISGPDTLMAVLQSSQDRKILVVRPGGDVDGWKVSEVSARGMVLQHGDQQRKLVLPEPEAIQRGNPPPK